MQKIVPSSPLVLRMRKTAHRTSRSSAPAGNNARVKEPALENVSAAPLAIGTQPSSRGDWERYFELYSLAPVALLWLDRNGVIEEINQEGCVVLGAPEATVVGRPLIVFVAAHDRRAFLKHMRRCRNQDGPVETELSIVARDGRVVPVCVHSNRSTHHQARIVSWTILIDLTDRLRLEEATRRAEGERQRAEETETVARAKNEAKDRFLAMLSHELRTPLTPALFAAARLVEDDMPEQSRMLGTVIKRNIEMEAHLIQDLLDVTRIDRGRLDLNLEVSNVHDVITEAMDVSLPHARSKQLELVSDFKATSFHVRGDVTRLRQVFWNLLSNAIKFSDSGHVEIRTMNDTSGSLRAIVSDTGIGMDGEVVDRLFTPFERHTVSSSRSGLGLGLAICKGIIDAHNGRIWATSAGLGRGSMFEVELPSVPPSAVGKSQLVDPGEGKQRRTHQKVRILVVDDDPDTVKMLASMLTADGHHLGVAHNLKEAVDLIREPWDIVVSDLGLPDGSGLDVARRFRRVSSKPRLIALSGYGSDGDLKASREAGFELHIVKPIDLAQLRRLIDHVAANVIPS
jgi:PAS domain S-box-containing protein